MKNVTLIETGDEASLKTIPLRQANLWMDPSPNKEDLRFWINRFRFKKVPFVLVQYDTEMLNANKEKMYRKVYGLFIDMKSWEAKDDSQ